MVTREFPPDSGGIGYYVYNLSKKLIERGHKVTVITRGSYTKTVEEKIDGINVFKVTFFPVYPFHIFVHGLFVNSVFKALEPEFDVIHIHSPVPPPIKTVLPVFTTFHTATKSDVKYNEVFDFNSLFVKWQSKIFYPPIESKLLKISNLVSVVSSSVSTELLEYGLNPKDVIVIGNGVNEKVFTPRKVSEPKSKYVLYTGILRARKGLFDLLESAQYVCAKHPEIKFIIAGSGSFFGKLDEEVRKRKMESNFKLLGYVKRTDLIELYKNAIIHVTPSHYEGLPTVLLEAMSCGLPVVATNVGGSKEVISNGVNGLLVPPKSPRILAEAILKLLEDKGLRERIGAAARLTIEERFSWDRITDVILNCYYDLISARH